MASLGSEGGPRAKVDFEGGGSRQKSPLPPPPPPMNTYEVNLSQLDGNSPAQTTDTNQRFSQRSLPSVENSSIHRAWLHEW